MQLHNEKNNILSESLFAQYDIIFLMSCNTLVHVSLIYNRIFVFYYAQCRYSKKPFKKQKCCMNLKKISDHIIIFPKTGWSYCYFHYNKVITLLFPLKQVDHIVITVNWYPFTKCWTICIIPTYVIKDRIHKDETNPCIYNVKM